MSQLNLNLLSSEISIGWSIQATLFSFLTHTPLFLCSDRQHTIREYFNSDHDLSKIGLKNEELELSTNYGKTKIGTHYRHVVDTLLFQLNLMGLLFKGTVNVDDTLSFHSKAGFQRKFEIDKVNIFDLDGVYGLERSKSNVKHYEVYDYTECGVICEWDLYLSGYKKLCQELWFCDSFNGHNNDKKDLVIVSMLDKEQIFDPNYSDHIMRIMAKDIIPFDTEMEYVDREVIEVLEIPQVKDTEKINYKLDSAIDQILKLDVHEKTQEFLRLYYGS